MIPKGSHIHLMGIGGTAMASLAGLLKELGYKISGSDLNVYPPMSTQLAELGIPVMEGYKKENLRDRPDLVIVGNVISRTNEEAQALLASDIPYTSLPKALGDYAIADRNSIVVAGTHGKTTTTALVAVLAEACGLKPGFLIGGIPINFSKSFRVPLSNWFVIEGDEYDTAFFDKVPKFVHYRPRYAILTSVEFDHADIYQDLNAVKKAFALLIERIPADGLLVVNGDDGHAMELAKECKCKVVTYGLESGDYHVLDRRVELGRNQFAVDYKGQRLVELAIKQFGPHNTLNSLAAFALARELKWPLDRILAGMASFQGVKRRQELIGEPNGITLIEDFAHHPTAVSLTLKTMRERFPQRRLFGVFEPRSATSRRKVFQQDYVKALSGADIAIVARPYDQSRIQEEDRFSTEELVGELKAAGGLAYEGQSVSHIIELLKKECRSGDVVLLMSNGGFDGIYSKLIQALSPQNETTT